MFVTYPAWLVVKATAIAAKTVAEAALLFVGIHRWSVSDPSHP